MMPYREVEDPFWWFLFGESLLSSWRKFHFVWLDAVLYFLRFEFELYLSFTHVGSLKSLSWSNPSHMAHNKVMWPDLLSLVNTDQLQLHCRRGNLQSGKTEGAKRQKHMGWSTTRGCSPIGQTVTATRFRDVITSVAIWGWWLFR